MILRSLTIQLCLIFLLQKESEAWTTRPALGSRARLPLQPSQQAWRKSPTVQRLTRSSNDEIEFIECDSDLGNSRRRLLGSIGAVAASALGISIAAPALPSNAEATLVSAKSVCDATVSVWSKNGRIIYLLGTAHISETSAELAGRLVKDTNPNGVFIELDPKRVSGTGALAQKFQGDENSPAPARESKIIVPVIAQSPGDGGFVLASGPPSSPGGEVAVGAAALPAPKPPPPKANNNPVTKAATAVVGKQLKGLYSRLDAAGFDSGEEFVRAVKEGKKLGADIVLGDRDVEVTLRRITEGLAKTDLKAFLSPDSELERTMQEMMPVNTAVQERLAGADNSQELSNEEFKAELTGFVEAMKTKENVKKIMGQLQRVAPALYEALVSERDAYMAAGLNGLNELESIVAVVGIAHADGIETTLQQNGWKAANPACPK